jgi:hypothetical protein
LVRSTAGKPDKDHWLDGASYMALAGESQLGGTVK